MPFLIEPQDELAPQVVQTLLKIQQDQGPSTLVSPRGEVTATGEVVCCVSTAVDRAERESDAAATLQAGLLLPSMPIPALYPAGLRELQQRDAGRSIHAVARRHGTYQQTT